MAAIVNYRKSINFSLNFYPCIYRVRRQISCNTVGPYGGRGFFDFREIMDNDCNAAVITRIVILITLNMWTAFKLHIQIV